jgi:zinc transport system permease protein
MFEYQFVIKALIAAVLASVTCGIIGTYVVSKRMVFLTGGITHASFGGIGAGYFLGFNPIFGAAAVAVLTGFMVEFMSAKYKLREDSAIGLLWALGMAAGIILIYLTPGYAPNLMSYLFGSILTVQYSDLLLMGFVALFLVLFFSLFFRNILYVAFDEEYARSYGIRVEWLKYLLIMLIALGIVSNIRVVGVILVLSLVTVPPNIALLFTESFQRTIWLSVMFSLTGTLAGLAASYYLNIPSGAAIVFVLLIMFLLARGIHRYIFKRKLGHLTKQKDQGYGL